MRAGRVVLMALLLPFLSAGCRMESSRTTTAEKHRSEKKSLSAYSSALDERLCQAVAEGDTDQVRTLIADGANLNARDEFGGTALFYALLDTPTEVVELLLANGTDSSLRDDYGTSVLHEATAQGRADLVGLFLARGVDVNLRDADRQTPLHEAVWQDNKDMVELLLAHGAAVNMRDKNGNTPLHIAAVNGYMLLSDLLVLKGADAKARNKQRLTPVSYARSMPPQEMIRLSADGSGPYSVIITNLREARSFLRSKQVVFDRIRIAGAAEVERAAIILRRGLEDSRAGWIERLSGCEYILANLDRYNREYAGFTRGRAKFVICNMNLFERDGRPLENRFSGGMDGGCDIVWVVIALDAKRVEWIECNGF